MTKPKKKIRIVYDAEGWAYYRRAAALQEYAPDDMDISIRVHTERYVDGPFDLIFDLIYGHVKKVRHQLSVNGWDKTLLLVSFNNGWPARKKFFNKACMHAHAVLINNEEYWRKAGPQRGTYTIANGVNRKIFKPTIPMAQREKKVIWVGSEYHRGTKNYDEILVPLAARLADKGISTDFQLVDAYGKLRTHEEMAEWYNTGSVYVVASKTEGTPNPALEAAGCGCAVVSTRVGNMPELIIDGHNGFIVGEDINLIENKIIEAMNNREVFSSNMLEAISSWDWEERSKDYYKLFRGLLDGKLNLHRALGAM